MATVVLDLDGAYVASCGECAYTEALLTEKIAGRRAAEHERRHVENEETLALLEHARQASPPVHAHLHSAQCTTASCPDALSYTHTGDGPCPITGTPCAGHPIPTRAELVARSLKRHGK